MLDLYGQQSVYSKDNFKSQKYKIKLTQRLLHVWLIFTSVYGFQLTQLVKSLIVV